MRRVSLLLTPVLLLALAGCASVAPPPDAKSQSPDAPAVGLEATAPKGVTLRTVIDGPDEKGRVRGKIVNDSQDYISDVEVTVLLDGDKVEKPEVRYFGELKYYTLAPGEEFPFVAYTQAKPGTRIDITAVGSKSSKPTSQLTFTPEPADGERILGRLTGGSRLLKAYELESTWVYLVPLDEQGLPLLEPQENGWALSFGTDLKHLNQPADLPPGGQLVVKYGSIRPEDWQVTRSLIDSGNYKVVVSRWRAAPDFPVSATGEVLSEQEVRYLTGLAPDEGQIERMTYREYLDRYKPAGYSYQIGDQTLLYVITTEGTSVQPRAGQYFNRHRTLMDAVTGRMYEGSHWWDPSEEPQPEGPGRFGENR